jgi:hypothetical protein
VSLADGRFLVPSRYEHNPYVAKFVALFAQVADRLGARVLFGVDVRAEDLPADCPFVVTVKPVQWGHSDGFRGLLSLPERIQVFGLWDDIHQGFRGTRYFSRDRWVLTRFFRRCDVILCVSHDPFVRWYPRHLHKLVHFPHFFSAEDFARVGFNETPLPKCILSGATGKFYPLRRHAARNPDVVVLAHPGYGGVGEEGGAGLFGEAYARELSKYRCAVTCSSVIDYTVAKYMELPAAGCLLLATHTPDLHLLGFEDGVNYLRVDESTFDATLADVLARPEAFEPIRRAGFELVHARHSDVNRADALEQLIRERCAMPTV